MSTFKDHFSSASGRYAAYPLRLSRRLASALFGLPLHATAPLLLGLQFIGSFAVSMVSGMLYKVVPFLT